jgi:leucine-rich repeat protein SHOC2
MPNWLSYRREGWSLSFHIPPVFHGLVLWVVHSNWSDITITIINKRNRRIFFGDIRTTGLIRAGGWIRYISRSEMGMGDYCADDELGLYFMSMPTGPAVPQRRSCGPVDVKEYGVHVIAEKLDSFEESAVERDTVMPSLPLYHLLPHPHGGSITASTPKQWSDFLFAELQNYNLNLWLFGKNAYFL